MTERNELMLAALTSAAVPSIVVAGVFPGIAHADGVDQAQVRDVAGRTYDVYASDTEAGRRRLAARVKAAAALADAREPGGLGFALDHVLGFAPGDDPKGPTGDTAVMVASHQDGAERPLDLLTLDDCAAMGTAIGAIHRLNPSFLATAGYPMYLTGQIRAQLTAWIARLESAGHVPAEITSSWSRIMQTEGLWSFNTCMVHGGFEDGDVRFDGSTITAVNNWQNMQVNDPARDLAWIFSKLDETHRNAVLTAYGRMMGNRLDDLIMLRANLWVQMEQVGDFIQAVKRADSQQIIRFKAQVDRLAHQLTLAARASEPQPSAYRPGQRRTAAAQAVGQETTQAKPPSTITVGTLLKEGERRRAAAATSSDRTQPGEDRTDSADIVAAGDYGAIADVPGDTGDAKNDDTNRTPVRADGEYAPGTADATASTRPQTPPSAHADMPEPSSSATIVLHGLANGTNGAGTAASGAAVPQAHAVVPSTAEGTDPDDTDERDIPQGSDYPTYAPSMTGARPAVEIHEPDTDTAATIVIPLLEREERALRDARAGLDAADADDTGDAAVKAADVKPYDAGGDVRNADAAPATPAATPSGTASSAAGSSDATPSDAADDESDDTPSVTPVVVAAPSVSVNASTGTVESDGTPQTGTPRENTPTA